ncbi:chemotaxis protein CheB [Chitinolyticbacter meiyuanensis]|uniref:chemotaxis protein CheB n=1 Tax=Chitinolyticbacter meiyuanensis TaxID=682798 RepID=UPI0011E5E7D4|nr:chemotaxis protein CheB [Chitinolyticbacter meiyuanensis]
MIHVPLPAQAVVIGASAGGIDALLRVLPALPASYPLPVIVVIHLSDRYPSLLAQLFAARMALPVHEAEDKQPIEAGHVYFAPPGYHLLVERNRHFALSIDAPVHYSRPAIDVLFASAADAYGAGLVGVLLTGANADGAAGLAAIARCGGRVWVQSPAEATVSAMPEAALKATKPDAIVTLDQLATLLVALPGKESP